MRVCALLTNVLSHVASATTPPSKMLHLTLFLNYSVFSK